MLTTFAAEDEREEQPITVLTGDILLTFERRIACRRKFQRAVYGAALGDELVQFEGKTRIAFRVSDAAP